jgi:thioredoxin 2
MKSDRIAAAAASETAADTVVLACRACGSKNPTNGSELATHRRCPECDVALAPLSVPLDVGTADLVAVVTSARVPVLIDFWAPWCPPCRLVAPIVKRVAQNVAGRALVLKVNTEQHQELAAEFKVTAIPTFVVIKGGKVVVQQSGIVSPGTMKRWLLQEATKE